MHDFVKAAVEMRRRPQPLHLVLSKEQLDRVALWLDQGMGMMDAAKKIKAEFGAYEDATADAVRQRLVKFRSRHVYAEKDDRLSKMLKTRRGRVRIEQHVNTMQELYHLYELQRTRVHKAVSLEEKGPLLMAATQGEIRCAADLLTRIGNLQLEIGVLPRAPKEVKGALQSPDGQVTQFQWTEADDRLFRLIESEHAPALEGEAEEVEDLPPDIVDPDGSLPAP